MKIRLHNTNVSCNAAEGETILLACARAGIILSAPCGGRHRCGKCTVRLIEGQITGDAPDSEGWVRSCAAVPLTDITIACPGELMDGAAAMPTEEPSPARRAITVGAAAMPAAVAIDIGTTTIAARLIDLNTSLALDTIPALNDQRAFGADVMSRIEAAQGGKTGELFTLINRQIRQILESFIDKWNLPRIQKLAVSGNTTMLHLFLNVDPSGMGQLPFTPVFLEARELSGAALALPVESVTVLPSIAAFIGGDITAGLAVLDILNIPGPSLLIDIGTNGEMALARGGDIFCCSTAAGPAFEGAEISCGMGGVKGAISTVEIADNVAPNGLSITTIGKIPPAGACGSGLVDAVAIMRKRGIIDETGFMADGEKGFPLAPGVSITGRDIRQFQLAKSAIFSGIRLLCKNSGLQAADIRNVFIAGGFGFYVNKINAAAAGLFPAELLDAISVCGNLSLQGAQECLTAPDFLSRCKHITAHCAVIDLAADPSFTDEFTNNMLFPST
jgi:uncharacterized 2Fe-2S/4Fe-4S cluster protein (DUF4445 family)